MHSSAIYFVNIQIGQNFDLWSENVKQKREKGYTAVP